jgi:hypothetical protein
MLKGNVLSFTPLTDSFMTYPQSVLVRVQWLKTKVISTHSTDELKAVALEESFNRISKLSLR